MSPLYLLSQPQFYLLRFFCALTRTREKVILGRIFCKEASEEIGWFLIITCELVDGGRKSSDVKAVADHRLELLVAKLDEAFIAHEHDGVRAGVENRK